jgi:hypothetical protein
MVAADRSGSNAGAMQNANTLGAARFARANIGFGISSLFIFFSVLLAAEVVLELAHIFYLQVTTFHPLPHLDEWRTFILFSRIEKDPGSWSLLLVPHAEHRPFLGRLVFLLDNKLVHGTGALSLVAIDCVQLGLIGIWIYLLTGKASRNEGARLAWPQMLALSVAAVLLSGHQMSNFIRGFQVTMFMAYFFATLSFAAFASALPKPASGRPATFVLLIALSCLSGICAAFSVGNGLIALPIVFVMACVRRRELPVGAILLIAITAAATIGAYVNAPGSILGRADYQLSPNRVGELAAYFLAFLGGPWASVAPNGTIIAGLVTLLLSACAAVRYWRRDRLCSFELVSVGLIALAIASAAMTALARLRFGLEGAVESRYSTTVLMLYAALLVSFWPRVQIDAEPAWATRPNPPLTAALAMLVVGILAYGIASHWKLPYDYSGFRTMKADAEVAYVANVQDPLAFEHVAPRPQVELAWRARDYVLRHNLSVFSTMAAQSSGRPLTGVFSASDGQCIGRLDQLERTIAGPNGGFRVAGWAWDSNNRSVPPAALLVEDGIVKGIGRFVRVRPDVVTAIPEAADVKAGFVGYVPRGVAKVMAYVLDRNQTSACRIPGDLVLPPE